MKTITVIDTFGFFFRSYYALPNLKNSKGEPTGLLTGFANFIQTSLREFPSDYMLFALDSKGKTFREEIDPNYKANRSLPPEDLKKQLPIAIEWIKKMGFAQYSKEGYEADDVIASMVKFAKTNDLKVRIVTHDKDLYQLIDDGKVVIYEPVKKREVDASGCFEKFGLPPSKIRDFLSLTGDSADNIPGVKGIGAVGAKKLLDEFGDIQNLYDNLEKVRNERTKELLKAGRENAFMSWKLTALDDTLDVYERLDKFKLPSEQPLLAIKDELLDNDMYSIINRLGTTDIKKQHKEIAFEPILLDTKEELLKVINSIPNEAFVAFDTETDSLNSRSANIVGFSFCFEEDKAYYVPIAHYYLGVGAQIDKMDAKEALDKLFTYKIIGQNLKFDLNVVEFNLGMKDIKIYADTMIMAWLLDSESSVGMDSLAKRLFGYNTIKFSDIVPKNMTFANVELNDACKYSAEDAWVTLKLYHKLKELLEPKLLELAKSIEFPFIKILRDMENEGIGVDTPYLKMLLEKSESAINSLTREIYDLSGREFNINSTQQMSAVLFGHLGLDASKKTKVGYSTDENVLNELLDKHPVIEKLLEYRELYKLKSTYIEPLLRLGLSNKASRIHTSFLQTGTSTGRLSSKEPNLQNIPVRTELGKEVRTAFIAKKGYKLVGIDYSQIELRLLAHFSLDSALVNAFLDDKDIHLATAAKLFGDKAKEMRSVAKSINFGLLYGMGAKKLALTLKVSPNEAKGYIESYFASFATVKNYLSFIEESAQKNGFIQTLLGRRRNFNFSSVSPLMLANYKREAVNAVFQGSAADLIKLAMLKIYDTLLDADAKLLLQIHDELIFEVKEENALEFSKKASAVMEAVYKLNVPLKTTVSIGDNWGELK
ncbi:MAG: DNA polymerase I [Campylobacteraceae bacterium]|jgi:DNA polymerase-1|nr:DNA polymerase I [Campylobacteraceae bacterium]